MKFIHQLHHWPPEENLQLKNKLLLVEDKEAGEKEHLPWAQKLHHNVVLAGARVQKPQVPAGHDAVQTSKHTLHQPGEDGVELLKGTERAAGPSALAPLAPTPTQLTEATRLGNKQSHLGWIVLDDLHQVLTSLEESFRG